MDRSWHILRASDHRGWRRLHTSPEPFRGRSQVPSGWRPEAADRGRRVWSCLGEDDWKKGIGLGAQAENPA